MRFLIYIVILVLVEYAIVTVNLNDRERSLELLKARELENIESEFKATINPYYSLSETIFQYVVNKLEVAELISRVYEEDKKGQDILRNYLKFSLEKKYEDLKKLGIKQLHFHLKDNTSFLRMHRPEKYGDNLTGIRETVAMANRLGQKVTGFEEGRIFNGFRFVFPLNYAGKHVGTVEVSVSLSNVISSMNRSFKKHYYYVLKKSIVQKKVFKSEKSNYADSYISDFYVHENNQFYKPLNIFEDSHYENEYISKRQFLSINQDIKGSVDKFLKRGNPFVEILKNDNEYYFVEFLPINNLKGEYPVWIISYQKSIGAKHIQDYFKDRLVSWNLVMFVLILFVLYYENNRQDAFKQYKIIKNVLDDQSTMACMTDGHNDVILNNSFLKFLGYKDLKDFKEHHKTVGEMFSIGDGYISHHTDKTWMEKFAENRAIGQESKVLMQDPEDGFDRVFLISIGSDNNDNINKVVTFTDITELENYQIILKDANEILDMSLTEKDDEVKQQEVLVGLIFDSVGVGIVLSDADENVIRYNDKFSELFELGYDEFIGHNFSELSEKAIGSDLNKIINNVEEMLFECEVNTPKNKRLDLLVNSSGIIHETGRRLYLRVFTDITEKKEIERKNKQQEKMLIQQSKMAALGEMIGVIAHQWKQPLNTISLLSTVMQEEAKEDVLSNDDVVELTDSIFEKIKFMVETMDDFRSFFKPAEKNQNFDLLSVVNDTVNIIGPQLEKNKVTVDLEKCCKDGVQYSIKGKANEFKQVLMNLMVNASDAISSRREKDASFAKKEGVVGIESVIQGKDIFIKIFDNGGGIPEENLNSIFDSFFTTKGEQGTGVGLYMSKLIIESKMYGQLSVSNNEDGAVFTIKVQSA